MNKLVTLTLLGFSALILAGCVFVRDPITGEIVGGIPLGTLAETGNQILGGAVGHIPVVGPFLQQAVLMATVGGVTTGGVSKMIVNKIESRRKASDMAREAAERDLAVAEAKLAAVASAAAIVNGGPSA